MDLKRMADICSAVVEDLGGEQECSEVQLLLIRDLAFAATMRDVLAAHLAATGPLTRAGKRKAALGAWHRASARVEGLARQIGLKRKPKDVDPLVAAHKAVREANRR